MNTHVSRSWTAVVTSVAMVAVSCCLIGLSGLFLGTGCDTDSATSEVTIHPDSVTLHAGQSQEFVATGGYTYSWSLKDEAIGSLSVHTGDRVIYNAISAPSNGTQVITVTSTIPGTSAGSSSTTASNTTTTTGYQVTAQAIVTFN